MPCTRSLQGPEAFARAFAVAPTPRPGDLVTSEDLKRRCRELGLPSSGLKRELAKRVKARQTTGVIFDEVLAEFEAMSERDRLEILPATVAEEVRRGPPSSPATRTWRAFTGGVPEVSIFWQEDGVPLKARFDYLKPRTVIDLKCFANQRERPVDVALTPPSARG